MAKKKAAILTTPRGVFIYPRLQSPDTTFKKEGVYRVKLELSAAAATDLIQMIDDQIDEKAREIAEANKGKKVKRADPPYSVDEETGKVTFSFKMTASGVREDGTSFTAKPAILTDKLEEFVEETSIGSGTEGKVAFTFNPFYTAMIGAGVSLRLKAVQILKLVSYSGGTYGFTAEGGADRPADDADADAYVDADDAQAF